MAWRLLSIIMGYLMLLLVFGGAAVFSFTSFMENELYGARRFSFVLVLLAYGIYRSYRLLLLHRQITQHEK